ncbi:MAG: FAD-dependent oxidoreductase [Bryobacteraceae bacterium]
MITTTTRADNLSKLCGGRFDVLIVGGGINGAGIARDLVLRDSNLRVALVEKNHFGSGTSGRNSHLIHGGLRYLKYFDFGLVREALKERAYLLQLAPHLVEPLEFFLPLESAWERLYYRLGLTIYDLLAGANRIGSHHPVPGGLVYFDARVQAARLVLETVLDAADRGLCSQLCVGCGSGAQWGDRAAGQPHGNQFACEATTVIDATGAWSKASKIRLVRGSHLIYPGF